MNQCRNRRLLIATFVVAAMTSTLPGCATRPAFDLQALPPLHTGQARFVFYVAKSSFLVPSTQRRMYIDERLYADIASGQFIVIDMTPGLKRVKLRSVEAGPRSVEFSFPIDLPAGHPVYGRVFSTGGYPSIGHYPSTFYGVVPEHLAISEMKGLTEIQSNAAAVAPATLQQVLTAERL